MAHAPRVGCGCHAVGGRGVGAGEGWRGVLVVCHGARWTALTRERDGCKAQVSPCAVLVRGCATQRWSSREQPCSARFRQCAGRCRHRLSAKYSLASSARRARTAPLTLSQSQSFATDSSTADQLMSRIEWIKYPLDTSPSDPDIPPRRRIPATPHTTGRIMAALGSAAFLGAMPAAVRRSASASSKSTGAKISTSRGSTLRVSASNANGAAERRLKETVGPGRYCYRPPRHRRAV